MYKCQNTTKSDIHQLKSTLPYTTYKENVIYLHETLAKYTTCTISLTKTQLKTNKFTSTVNKIIQKSMLTYMIQKKPCMFSFCHRSFPAKYDYTTTLINISVSKSNKFTTCMNQISQHLQRNGTFLHISVKCIPKSAQ